MKTIKVFLTLITALLFNAAIASGFAAAFNVGVAPVFLGITILGIASQFMPVAGMAFMAIQKEIWLNDIVANIFKANPHLNYAMNADSFVMGGKVVHIPNAGSKPGVKRNRDKLPATVLIREDVDITFSLDEYTTDPILIPNAEEYELSYDKRASVTSEQQGALDELVGDWFFRYWAPSQAANIVRTTGDAIAAHYGTGNRKKVTAADVKKIAKLLTNMGVPQEGRVAALDGEMFDQFTDSLTTTQYKDFSRAYNEADNTIGKLFGFTFLDPRATVLRYDNSTLPVVKDPDASVASADNGAALFWQKDMVIRALGQKEFFENENDPTYYGDVYSALLRAGGRIKRSDSKGVIALVQAAST